MKGTSCFALGRDENCRENSKYCGNKGFRNFNSENNRVFFPVLGIQSGLALSCGAVLRRGSISLRRTTVLLLLVGVGCFPISVLAVQL